KCSRKSLSYRNRPERSGRRTGSRIEHARKSSATSRIPNSASTCRSRLGERHSSAVSGGKSPRSAPDSPAATERSRASWVPRRALRLFADWHERRGRASLARATEADLAEYFAWRYSRRSPGKKHGIRSSTQARLHSSLKRFYRFLARGRRIEIDPTLKLDPPKKPPRFPKTLSEPDVEALLAQPDPGTPLGLRDRAMLEVLYASGLRVS